MTKYTYFMTKNSYLPLRFDVEALPLLDAYKTWPNRPTQTSDISMDRMEKEPNTLPPSAFLYNEPANPVDTPVETKTQIFGKTFHEKIRIDFKDDHIQ